MANVRVSNGAKRRELRRYYKSINARCGICGKPIDYSLPAYHPLSFEIDEKIPISKLPKEQRVHAAISRETTQAAHRQCNQRKGNKIIPKEPQNAKEEKISQLPITTSRTW